MLLKSILGLRSSGGARGRLSVLIFHRVLPRPDPLCPGEVDAACFERICRWLTSWGHVLPLDEAVVRLRLRDLPAGAMSITFDDGYADNFTEALPILERHGVPATFFIATQFLDGGRMWNDTVIEAVRGCSSAVLDLAQTASLRSLAIGSLAVATREEKRAGIERILSAIKYLPVEQRESLATEIARVAGVEPPGDLMMTPAQVVEMRRRGMQIGAHTRSHPILARLDRDAAFDEIAASKAYLEQLLGERVSLFAYPNGKPGADYDAQSVAIVRELGFDAAVSTAHGFADAYTDVYQIPRFTPWKRTQPGFFLRLFSNLGKPGA